MNRVSAVTSFAMAVVAVLCIGGYASGQFSMPGFKFHKSDGGASSSSSSSRDAWDPFAAERAAEARERAEARATAKSYNEQGITAFNAGDWKTAAELFRAALKLCPDDNVIRANLDLAIRELYVMLAEEERYQRSLSAERERQRMSDNAVAEMRVLISELSAELLTAQAESQSGVQAAQLDFVGMESPAANTGSGETSLDFLDPSVVDLREAGTLTVDPWRVKGTQDQDPKSDMEFFDPFPAPQVSPMQSSILAGAELHLQQIDARIAHLNGVLKVLEKGNAADELEWQRLALAIRDHQMQASLEALLAAWSVSATSAKAISESNLADHKQIARWTAEDTGMLNLVEREVANVPANASTSLKTAAGLAQAALENLQAAEKASDRANLAGSLHKFVSTSKKMAAALKEEGFRDQATAFAAIAAEFAVKRVAVLAGPPGAIGVAGGAVVVGGGQVALALEDMKADKELLAACESREVRRGLKMEELRNTVLDLQHKKGLVEELRNKSPMP
jgi:hypothetical protein